MIFNEAQTRPLLATFKYMDHSLENALSARLAKRMIETSRPCRNLP
jgi:hypothetical protein